MIDPVVPDVRARDEEARSLGERTAHAADLLRTAGLRSSAGRAAMIGVLLQLEPRHVEASEIHARLGAAGYQADLSGVHRAMGVFSAHGLVHACPVRGPVAYGLTDPPHHHAVCSVCGIVVAVPIASLGTVRLVGSDAGDHGFTVDDHGLVLSGRCGACSNGS